MMVTNLILVVGLALIAGSAHTRGHCETLDDRPRVGVSLPVDVISVAVAVYGSGVIHRIKNPPFFVAMRRRSPSTAITIPFPDGWLVSFLSAWDGSFRSRVPWFRLLAGKSCRWFSNVAAFHGIYDTTAGWTEGDTVHLSPVMVPNNIGSKLK
jgi:hypothetical protein